jgi:methylated-DNA-protein-cysteine methyltransferase-like protein
MTLLSRPVIDFSSSAGYRKVYLVKRMQAGYTQSIISVIRKIPRKKVSTYGQVALLAGNPRGVRQVVWILHSSSRKHKLPWHRVINARGRISLARGNGYEVQKKLLEKEGVEFRPDDSVDLKRFQWNPRSSIY